jgi:hypothetical protein
METSERGWARVDPDARFWIPCPAAFPPGMNRESWAAEVAGGWWERSGLRYSAPALTQLVQVFSFTQEHGYTLVPCHQIWIYLRDPTFPPLAVHIGIWKSTGERAQRLRELTGADDQGGARRPDISDVETTSLGAGLRTVRYRMSRDTDLMGVLGYGFRLAEFETDLQIFTRSASPRHLTAAFSDIDDFVRAISVCAGTLRRIDGVTSMRSTIVDYHQEP